MTLVLDASAIAEFLVSSAVGQVVAAQMEDHVGELHCPHLAVIETASVLRAWVRRGELPEPRASAALVDLVDLPARRWPGEDLLARMWELRDDVTAYDAAYVALAEMLDADLLTTDRRLARGVEGIADCRVLVAAVDQP